MSLKKYIICRFCVQSGKFYTGTACGARNNYQVWLHCTSPFLQSLDTSVSQSHIRHTPTFPVPCSHPTRRHGLKQLKASVCVYVHLNSLSRRLKESLLHLWFTFVNWISHEVLWALFRCSTQPNSSHLWLTFVNWIFMGSLPLQYYPLY